MERENKDLLDGKVVAIIGSSSINSARNGINFMEHIYRRSGIGVLNHSGFGSKLTALTEDYAAESINQLKKIDGLPTTGIDLILIQPGMNDDTDSVPVGTWESVSYTEFYYCLHQMCKKLYDKFPTVPFGVITGQYYGTQIAKESIYQNAIKEVCGYYGVPVCDLHAEGGTPYNYPSWKSQNTRDNLHLNNAGHLKLSYRVEAFIRQLLGH